MTDLAWIRPSLPRYRDHLQGAAEGYSRPAPSLPTRRATIPSTEFSSTGRFLTCFRLGRRLHMWNVSQNLTSRAQRNEADGGLQSSKTLYITTRTGRATVEARDTSLFLLKTYRWLPSHCLVFRSFGGSHLIPPTALLRQGEMYYLLSAGLRRRSGPCYFN
jgi:hypothetical protein